MDLRQTFTVNYDSLAREIGVPQSDGRWPNTSRSLGIGSPLQQLERSGQAACITFTNLSWAPSFGTSKWGKHHLIPLIQRKINKVAVLGENNAAKLSTV
jgi:hypothetical protein